MKIAYICVFVLIILIHLILLVKAWVEDKKFLFVLTLLRGVLLGEICIRFFENNCLTELFVMFTFGFMVFLPLVRGKK